MAQKELRIGVIGVGGRGGLARLAHQPENGSRVVAGIDVDNEEFVQFRERFGSDVFTSNDYKDLIKMDLDAVFVTSPDFCHEEHAVAMLASGKAVYLEKPMAITVQGCDRILETAYRNRSRLYLGHNMRHMKFVQKMKELIDAGRIGQVKAAWCRHFIAYGGDAYYKDWHADRSKSTSLLLQKGAHDIDVMHWLCGSYTRRVTGMGGLTLYDQITDRRTEDEPWDASWYLNNWPPLSQKKLNPVVDVEDLSMICMQMDNGVFASYQQCHYTPDGWRNYTIIGTEGRIENFGDSPGNCAIKLWNSRVHFNPWGDESYFIRAETGSHGGADPRIVNEFLQFVREGGKTMTSPIAARNSVVAGVMATESLRAGGQAREVPRVPEELLNYFECGQQ